MSKDPDSPILPHLRSEELSDRDHEEFKLGRQLSACRRGDDFDTERSYHVMQDSAEQIFDVMYAAFRKRSGYKDEWVPEMVRLAVFRTLSASLGYIQYGIRNLSLDALGETLEETIRNHIKELKSSQLKTAALNANPSEREALRDSYRTAFPDSGIMDICWAAKQHYREWTRWLNGELKDGCKPDRQFRLILTSGRDAKQLRKEVRPKNWK